MKIPGNDKCADCNSNNPTYASTNIGVLICEVCSNCHKTLGSNISKLQSISNSKWTMKLLEIIQEKGNMAVNEELEFDLKNFEKPKKDSSRYGWIIYNF